MALPNAQAQLKAARRTAVGETSNARPRVLARKARSSSSEESDEQSEQESGEQSDEESGEDEVELATPRRREMPSTEKKNASKRRPDSAAPSSTRQPKASSPAVQAHAKAVQPSLRTAPHSTSETQRIAEKMSLRELQEQEKALAFFHAQKRRNVGAAALTTQKGGINAASTNGAHTPAKTNGSGRRARMGVTQKETPETSSSLTYIAPPARNGFLASTAQLVSPAKCTATPAEKPTNPVIHSTAWRRLVFKKAPPNILHAVSTTPYLPGKRLVGNGCI
ncbi:unnamed protein product [Phytophthora fragariaefolia]|uniref:Unnamed protein product n=1 Tax=Phytophthora fragariaefolia TaxID=1490495 RepID=A0A9W6X8I7_9STRA|nr:unnamed protein product [Phytophthora fragariaefolia]